MRKLMLWCSFFVFAGCGSNGATGNGPDLSATCRRGNDPFSDQRTMMSGRTDQLACALRKDNQARPLVGLTAMAGLIAHPSERSELSEMSERSGGHRPKGEESRPRLQI